MNVSIPIASGATNPLAFTLTYPAASTSQYGVGFAVSKNSQDGYTTGQLAGYAIASDGTISGQYTNGQTRVEGQVALAGFINPQGLVAQGNNQWSESSASGQPVVGAPGVGNNGLVQSGALEQSNTDVTQQLVDMITAQRVYQANAETVKTEDQVQQTLLNLR
jgi:flagellar hook protein FlgE